VTRQQQWSRQALDYVLAAKDDDTTVSTYNTLCQKMPSLIQRSGLLQAVVFVQSRGTVGSRYLDDLANTYGLADTSDLRGQAQTSPLPAYMALTRDLIEVSIWFRRFAQIELGDTED